MELQEAETEHSVGAFSLDILAKDSDGYTVIIENQLEDTNHDHLGKLLTYAAGTDAKLSIWVVKRAREEHQKAIEWLNENTGMSIGFALVEVSAIKVGDSLPAPLFTLVEAPNDWAKSVKPEQGLSELQQIQVGYWQSYRETAMNHELFSKKLKTQKALPQHWSNIAVGSSAYHMNVQIGVKDKWIGIEFYIDSDKSIFETVKESLDIFEKHLGCKVDIWEAQKSSGLRVRKKNCDVRDKSKWPEFNRWHLDMAVRMKEALEEIGL